MQIYIEVTSLLLISEVVPGKTNVQKILFMHANNFQYKMEHHFPLDCASEEQYRSHLNIHQLHALRQRRKYPRCTKRNGLY